MEPWSGSRGESPSPRRRSAGHRASPSANPVGAMRPRSPTAVPTAVLPLSRFVFVVAVALALIAVPAVASEVTTTGGAQAAPVAKKVSVKRIQRALGVHADGMMGPQT